MHTKKHEGHREQVQVLPVNYVPFIGGQGFVDVHIGEETKGENEHSEIYPCKEEHEYCESGDDFVLFYVCLKVESAACHENITGVMDDQDHDSSCNLVAHHGEKDEAGGHKVMEHPLVVFLIVLFYHHKLEDRKNMHSQLEAEVDFECWSVIRGPVWVLLINLGARSAPTRYGGEPILFTECKIGCESSNNVEDCIVAELQHVAYFLFLGLRIVIWIQKALNRFGHEVEIGVFGRLHKRRCTKARKKPRVHHLKESAANT